MRHLLKHILLLSLFALGTMCHLLAAGSPIRLDLSLDEEKARLGDVLNLTVRIESDPSVTFDDPDPATLLPGMDLRDTEIMPPLQEQGRNIIQYRYRFASFKLGKQKIGPLVLEYKDATGKRGNVEHKGIKFTVESLLPAGGKAELRDIKPPEEVRYPFWYYLTYVAAAILLIAAIYLLAQFLKKRHAEISKIQAPPLPPHILAQQRLKEMKEMDLPAKGKVREYYDQLAAILREYIEGRFALPAPDRTTTELLQEMRGIDIDCEVINRVKDLLTDCDFVKFAKFIPPKPEWDKDYELAVKIVSLTSPPAETRTEAHEAAHR